MKNYKSSVSILALCALLSVPAYAGLFSSDDESYAEDIEPTTKIRVIDETRNDVQLETDSVVYIPEEKAIPTIQERVIDTKVLDRLDRNLKETADLVDSSDKKIDLIAKDVDQNAQEVKDLISSKSKEEIQSLENEIEDVSKKGAQETTFLTPSSQLVVSDSVGVVEEIKPSSQLDKTSEDRAAELKEELLSDLKKAKDTRKNLLGSSVVEREVPEAKIVKPAPVEESAQKYVTSEEEQELAKNKVSPAVSELVAEKKLTAEEKYKAEEADKSRALIARIIAEGKARQARKRAEEIEERERAVAKSLDNENKATILRAPKWSKTPSEEKAQSLFDRLTEMRQKPIKVQSPDLERVDAVVAESNKAISTTSKELDLPKPAARVNVKDLYKVTKVDHRDILSLPDVSDEIAVHNDGGEVGDSIQALPESSDLVKEDTFAKKSMIFSGEAFSLLPKPSSLTSEVSESVALDSSKQNMVAKSDPTPIANAVDSLPKKLTLEVDNSSSLTSMREDLSSFNSVEQESLPDTDVNDVYSAKNNNIVSTRQKAPEKTVYKPQPLSILDKKSGFGLDNSVEAKSLVNKVDDGVVKAERADLDSVALSARKPALSAKEIVNAPNPAQEAVEARVDEIQKQKRVAHAAQSHEERIISQHQKNLIQQPQPVVRPQYYYIPVAPSVPQPIYYQQPPMYAPQQQVQRQIPPQQVVRAQAPLSGVVANVPAQLVPAQQAPVNIARSKSSVADYRRPVRKRMSSDFVTRSVSVNQLEKKKQKTAAELAKITFKSTEYPEKTSPYAGSVASGSVQPFAR